MAGALPASAQEPEERPSASSVTVITRGEIEARQWRTLADVLRNQPGVHLSQLGGVGQTTQIFFRGQRAGRVLLRIDGIDVSDPGARDPGLVIPDLQTLEIERIELRRGPQSTSSGSDAVGGVIDVVTRRGEGAIAAWAGFEAGSSRTTQQSIGFTGGNARIAYSFGYSNLHSAGSNATRADLASGPEERDGYQNDALAGRVDLLATRALSFTLTGRYVRSDLQADRPVFELPFGPIDFSGADAAADRRGLERGAKQLFLGATGNLELWKGRWSQQWSARYASHDRREEGAFGRCSAGFGCSIEEAVGKNLSGTDSESKRLSLAWVNEFKLAPDHVLRIGAETQRESFQRSTLATEVFDLDRLAQVLASLPPRRSPFLLDPVQLLDPAQVDSAIRSLLTNLSPTPDPGPDVNSAQAISSVQALIAVPDGPSLPVVFRNPRAISIVGSTTTLPPTGLQQRTGAHRHRRDFALFAEDRFTFLEDFFAEGSVRLNDQGQYGSRLSYRAGVGWVEPTTRLKLYANVATGFRDPELTVAATIASVQRRTTDEPLTPGFIGADIRREGDDLAVVSFAIEGDESLEPEVTRGIEVGAEIPLGANGIARIGYFTTRSRGVLGLRGGVVVGDRIKLGQDDILETRSRGIELDADLIFPFGARLALGYTYTHSELRHSEPDLFEQDPSSLGRSINPFQRRGGDDELGVPKHQGSVALSLSRWDPLSVVVSTRYVGTRNTQGDLGRGFERFAEPSFMTADVALAYSFGERFTVFSRVENIFDSDHGGGLGSQSAGRAAYVGVATKY